MPELLSNKPTFTADEAHEFSVTHFGIRGQIRELPSERDQNFKVSVSPTEEWVLKISNSDTPLESIQLQQDIAKHLSLQFNDETIPASAGTSSDTLPSVKDQRTGLSHLCRMVPFRSGATWADYTPITPIHIDRLGHVLGKMTRMLQGYEHPGAHRHLQWDLQHGAAIVRDGIDKIESSDDRTLILNTVEQYEKQVQE